MGELTFVVIVLGSVIAFGILWGAFTINEQLIEQINELKRIADALESKNKK